MDTPVVVYLGNENLVSVTVHASVDVTGTEFVRVWHTVGLNPTDRAWVTYQNFVFVKGVTFMLPPDFCTFAQVLSCLPDIYKIVSERDGCEVVSCYRVRPGVG